MAQALYESLQKAIANSRTDVVRSLLFTYEQNNQDQESLFPIHVLNAEIPPNGTLLHLAVKLDEVDIVRTLLSVGSNPSIQNEEGETAYDLVCSNRMTTVFNEELLKASGQSDVKKVMNLLQAGVSVNVHDCSSSQNTALHWAASYGSENTLICLLEHGADVNAVNSQGMTPLHDAVNRKIEKSVEILMEAGANPLVKATKGKYEGQSPLSLAQDQPSILNVMWKYCKNEMNMVNEKGDSAEVRRGSLESLATETDLALSVSQLSLLSNDTPPPKSIPVIDSDNHSGENLDPGIQLLWPKPQVVTIEPVEPFILPSKELNIYIERIIYPHGLKPKILNVLELYKSQFESIDILLSYNFENTNETLFNCKCVVNNYYFSRKESYKICVSSKMINLIASDLAGLYYGLSTLHQLFKLAVVKHSLPFIHIEDWPSVSHRGILIDVTLDSRVTNMITLKHQIEMLSTLKINQVHLLFLLKPETSWPCYYSKRDLLELETFCQERFVSIVPTFDILPGEEFSQQMLLCLITILFSFSSCECLHLGKELSKPDLIELFPKHVVITSKPIENCLGLTVIELDQQNDDEFMSFCSEQGQAGQSLILMTSTMTSNSLAGCPEQSSANIFRAAQTARILRVVGFMIANWSGVIPHHTPLCFSWSPWLAAAGLAWNLNTPWDLVHEKHAMLLNHHIFQDAQLKTGRLLVDLGNVERLLGHQFILYQLIESPDTVDMEQLSPGCLQRALQLIKDCQIRLELCQPLCSQSEIILNELSFTINFMLFACRIGRLLLLNGLKPGSSMSGISVINIGISNLPPTACTDLANKLLSLTEEYRTVWLARHLLSGLHHSFQRFQLLLKALVPDNQTSLPPLLETL